MSLSSTIVVIICFLAIFSAVDSEPLLEVLRNAAGIYSSTSGNIKNYDLSKTVLVTACNFGYVNFLHNLKCYTDRLSMKLLVFSMDAATHKYISESMPNKENIFSYFWAEGEQVEEKTSDFASHQFHVITTRKIEVVLQVLEKGYDAIFIDSDIALLRDPLEYLLWNGVDYVHSVNWICPHSDRWDFYKTQEEGNTGFYFVRSNERTISLFKTIIELAPKNPTIDDQTIFWNHVRTLHEPVLKPLAKCENVDRTASAIPETELVTCHLDGCLFSVGALRGAAYTWLEEKLKQKHEKAVTIHANYLKGSEAKISALEKHGYWIADRADRDGHFSGHCRPFQPPF